MPRVTADTSDTQARLHSDAFNVLVEAGAVVSLRYTNDTHDTDYILAGARFGDLAIRYRADDGAWQPVSASDPVTKRLCHKTTDLARRACRTTWTSVMGESGGLCLTTEFALEGDALLWTIGLGNAGSVMAVIFAGRVTPITR